MNRGAWAPLFWATVHSVPKSQTQLERLSTMNFKMVKKINVMLHGFLFFVFFNHNENNGKKSLWKNWSFECLILVYCTLMFKTLHNYSLYTKTTFKSRKTSH